MKNKLTALIVSFYRYEYLEKCVSSLREVYPDINIIIGNNGPEDKRKEALAKKYNAEYHQLPFDCGICVGRNMLVEKIKTPYTLIGDDDFYYTEFTKMDYMLTCLETNKDLDLVGGRISEGGVLRNYQGNIEDHGNHFIYKPLVVDDSEEYQECELTFNYFVAKTDALKKVKWDDQIKVAYEHSAFFIDFNRAGYKVAFFPHSTVIHKPQISIENRQEYDEYKVYRMRKNDKKRFFEKFKIDYIIDMGGRKDVFDGTGMQDVDFLITHMDRKECLEKLLFSIAKYCPNANIKIGDQTRIFKAREYHALYERLFEAGLKNKPTAYNLPEDCGLSYARNFLIKNSQRKYKLILEDDFVFTEKTDIGHMSRYLEEHPKHGIIGGAVLENGQELDFVHNFVHVFMTKVLKHVEIKDTNDVDCIPNFFLARNEIFGATMWDEEIKINGEHQDFFYRFSKTDWKVAYDNFVSINHEKIKVDGYKEKRSRTEFLVKMMNKHGFKKIVYRNGFTYEVNNGIIKNYKSFK